MWRVPRSKSGLRKKMRLTYPVSQWLPLETITNKRTRSWGMRQHRNVWQVGTWLAALDVGSSNECRGRCWCTTKRNRIGDHQSWLTAREMESWNGTMLCYSDGWNSDACIPMFFFILIFLFLHACVPHWLEIFFKNNFTETAQLLYNTYKWMFFL